MNYQERSKELKKITKTDLKNLTVETKQLLRLVYETTDKPLTSRNTIPVISIDSKGAKLLSRYSLVYDTYYKKYTISLVVKDSYIVCVDGEKLVRNLTNSQFHTLSRLEDAVRYMLQNVATYTN